MRHTPLAGFTLIEVLVVITILSIIAIFTTPVGFSTINNYSLESDRDVLVALLERARNQSLANVHSQAHGVAIQANSYVGYEGTSYATRDATQDIIYPRTTSIAITGGSEILFQPLTATSTTTTLTLQANTITETIEINQEGSIDW